MEKLFAVLTVIIIALSFSCGLLLYQIGAMQNQNSELKTQTTQLENQIDELEKQTSELEDQIDELEKQIENLQEQIYQKKLPEAKQVKIIGL